MLPNKEYNLLMGEVKMKAKMVNRNTPSFSYGAFHYIFVKNSLQTQLTNKGVNNEKGLLMVSLKDS